MAIEHDLASSCGTPLDSMTLHVSTLPDWLTTSSSSVWGGGVTPGASGLT